MADAKQGDVAVGMIDGEGRKHAAVRTDSKEFYALCGDNNPMCDCDIVPGASVTCSKCKATLRKLNKLMG